MSLLNRDGSSIYDHFNKSAPISVPLDMDALAETLEDANYGTVRFLAALMRVRKRLLAERIANYHLNGHHDIAEVVERRGDPLANAIKDSLLAGEF